VELNFGQVVPVILMIAGAIVAASLGRVLYQIALSVTGADNGFPDPCLHRFDIVPLIVADCRFAFCCQLDVLCRLVCRLDVAPVFLAKILGTAGSTMIKRGCRFG